MTYQFITYDCTDTLHVFLDGRKCCECCRRVNPDAVRCKHRPEADVVYAVEVKQ